MTKLHSLPNVLTAIRIFLTPFCIYFLCLNQMGISLFLFILASLTDMLDGYFARKFNAISKLGAFLDPLADKLLVVSVFITLYYMKPEIVDIYILLMILFRDVFVTILRIFMETKGSTMTTSNLSKVKTALQMLMIVLVFTTSHLSVNLGILYYFMLGTSILTFYTGVHYLFCNYKNLKLLISSQ